MAGDGQLGLKIHGQGVRAEIGHAPHFLQRHMNFAREFVDDVVALNVQRGFVRLQNGSRHIEDVGLQNLARLQHGFATDACTT